MSTDPGDIVLDFFLGSGTTAATAHKMKRQYIGIEQMDYGDDDPTIRIQRVINGDSAGISGDSDVSWTGGGSVILMNIAENAARYREAINVCTPENVDSIYIQLTESYVLSYRTSKEALLKELETFKTLTFDLKVEALSEMVDANHLYVNFEDIDEFENLFSSSDLAANLEFYEN
jgi:adenine-specific DNA-methyltransferase